MTIDEFLRDERANGGVLATEFAARIGTTEAHLSRIRRGGNTTRDMLVRIIRESGYRITAAGALGLSSEELGGNRAPEPVQ
jgi:hypothetical protein